jgi:hypothetical protein
MAERDGDRQAWRVDVRRRAPGQQAEGLMRATADRHLAPGAAPRYVWAERPPPCAVGTLPLALAHHPARPPRPVTLAVTAKPVPFDGARRPGGQRPPVTGSAV